MNEPVEIISKRIIEKAVDKYKKMAIGCSFGKDSMVVVKLARDVDPNIKIFSVMTRFKPIETFKFLISANKKMGLDATVYMVANEKPKILDGIDVRLLPTEKFIIEKNKIESQTGKPLYLTDPDECCRFLKVEPTKIAVKDLDAWISGLRKSEGRTRVNFRQFEKKGGLVKINPILEWSEADIWRFTAVNRLPVNPLYGKGYRSLGCITCSNIGGRYERSGRWKGTKKVGGECGIHTQCLK